jgi:hypothetical protein
MGQVKLRHMLELLVQSWSFGLQNELVFTHYLLSFFRSFVRCILLLGTKKNLPTRVNQQETKKSFLGSSETRREASSNFSLRDKIKFIYHPESSFSVIFNWGGETCEIFQTILKKLYQGIINFLHNSTIF